MAVPGQGGMPLHPTTGQAGAGYWNAFMPAKPGPATTSPVSPGQAAAGKKPKVAAKLKGKGVGGFASPKLASFGSNAQGGASLAKPGLPPTLAKPSPFGGPSVGGGFGAPGPSGSPFAGGPKGGPGYETPRPFGPQLAGAPAQSQFGGPATGMPGTPDYNRTLSRGITPPFTPPPAQGTPPAGTVQPPAGGGRAAQPWWQNMSPNQQAVYQSRQRAIRSGTMGPNAMRDARQTQQQSRGAHATGVSPQAQGGLPPWQPGQPLPMGGTGPYAINPGPNGGLLVNRPGFAQRWISPMELRAFYANPNMQTYQNWFGMGQ